jgi:hypothetical protein
MNNQTMRPNGPNIAISRIGHATYLSRVKLTVKNSQTRKRSTDMRDYLRLRMSAPVMNDTTKNRKAGMTVPPLDPVSAVSVGGRVILTLGVGEDVDVGTGVGEVFSVGVGVGLSVGLGMTVGNTDGKGDGVAVGVGEGLDVATGVPEGSGELVGSTVGVGVTLGVELGVGVAQWSSFPSGLLP